MKENRTTQVVSVSLPPDLVNRMDDAAARLFRNRSGLVRAVFESWLHNPATAPLARQTLAAPDGIDKRGAPG